MTPARPSRALIARSRYDVTRAELADLLDGEPRYRVDQVWDGLYARALADPSDITTLPRVAPRATWTAALPPALTPVTEQHRRRRATP